MTDKERLTKEWGPKCPDYEPGCSTCEAWKLFDKLGVVPHYDRVIATVNNALREGELK
jgi:hypothetical protein